MRLREVKIGVVYQWNGKCEKNDRHSIEPLQVKVIKIRHDNKIFTIAVEELQKRHGELFAWHIHHSNLKPLPKEESNES